MWCVVDEMGSGCGIESEKWEGEECLLDEEGW